MKRVITTIFSMAVCTMAIAQNAPSLEHQAAKLLMIGVKGTSLSDNNPVIEDVVDRGVSGIILFEHNIEPVETGIDSRAHFEGFITDLKTLRQEPILIAIDQEGGLVNRMKSKYGFVNMLSHKEVGEADGNSLARKNGAVIASEVASVGINVNFAPVVDVDINPKCPVIGGVKRSFSADANRVAELAYIYVEEHHKHGVLTSIKHFPGHGNSIMDSHLGFTDISDTWKKEELIPYKELINNKLCDMVMVSHLYNSKFDTEYPATLSKPTIDSLLRGVLGWQGVVVSDDMQMKAITDHYGFEQGVILALNAGVDLFIISSNIRDEEFSITDRFIKTVVDGVESGIIERARVDEAAARVEALLERVK
ncbi:MAG: glycoside hydrolase family 3 N-terminal domain-containing protein [Rikenellaceae bacterium]